MARGKKLVPLVVALPLFLQHLDSSMIATALPTIAGALHVEPLRLNLAITAYLFSLAVFLPASGWIADRFGSRRVFCAAIAIFSAASGLCGLANSLETLVLCRVLQGMGGAMMVPVGRLIMLRSVTPAAMITAMIWFTVPPSFGRLLGPFVGGLMVTWVSWRWIFLVHVPLGLLGIALALALLEPGETPQDTPPFDAIGFVLLGFGLAGVLAALEAAGTHVIPGSAACLFAISGVASLVAYYFYSCRARTPLIDLRILRHSTFFASVVGGFPLRLAIGAVPFLLPLLFQLGFGLSPLYAGLLMTGTALGSLATRAVLSRLLRHTGFRPLLMGATVCSSLCYLVYASFSKSTPDALLFAATVVGGLLISIVTTSLQTLAYSEIPQPLMGQATALSTMAQQLSFSLGISFAVELLQVSVWWRGAVPNGLLAADFSPAFFSMAICVLFALFFFARLPACVGSEFRGK